MPKQTEPTKSPRAAKSPRTGFRISNSTLWLLILTGLLPSLVSALVSTHSQHMLLDKAAGYLQISADHLSDSFHQHVSAADDKLRDLTSSSLLADSPASQAYMLPQLESMKANSKTFGEFLLINSDGSLLASTVPLPEQFVLPTPVEESSAAYSTVKLAEDQPEGLLFTSVVTSRTDSTPLLLVGFVPLRNMTIELQRFGLGYSGMAIVADSQNHILACSFPELSGKFLSVLDQPPARVISPSGSESSRRTGTHYYVVSRSLSDAPNALRIIVAQSRAEILESSLQSSHWSLITVAVITPLVLLLGLIFTGSVRNSLNALINGTRRIAEGDFSPLDIPKPYWEIGELAKSFEQMKSSLSENRQRLLQYQMGLEDLVAEKTRQLQQSERKYRTLYESSRDALVLLAPNGNFISGNEAGVRIFGFQNEKELTALTLAQCSPDQQPDGVPSCDKAQKMLGQAAKEGSHFFDWLCKRADGTEFISTILLTKVELDDEEILQATVRDVTEDKRLQDMLVEQAEVDQLTGLFNRRALSTNLRQSWARRQRYGQEFSLMMIDIDQFKQVNDTYGHQAGDEVLQQIAQVMLFQCRDSDFAARYGGEEFAIVLANTNASEAVNLAQRCRRQIEDMEFIFNGTTVKLTASFGVADAGDLLSTEALIQRADQALYRAKRAGRNQVELIASSPAPTT